MPEGPELHLAAKFINRVCFGRHFSGKVIKSAVSTKNPDIEWKETEYTINAVSRGKEIKLTLDNEREGKNMKTLDIVFRFGMSGKFAFEKACDLHKHAHLNFYTKADGMVLSFVDYRRFGKWEPGGEWGSTRGPCVISEYDKFRENVLDNIEKVAFNKPICEVLLDQKYFNGIGNYLRAEILYRCKIPPFCRARDCLQVLKDQPKSETPDILQLCNLIPVEVVNLTGSMGYDPGSPDDYSAFKAWLQCYYQPHMNNMVDHHGRTMWFQGPAGPLAPAEKKTRGRLKAKHKKMKQETEEISGTTDNTKPDDVRKKETYSSAEETVVKSERVTRSRVKIAADDMEIPKKSKVKVEKPSKKSKTVLEEIHDSPIKTRLRRKKTGLRDAKILQESPNVSPYFS